MSLFSSEEAQGKLHPVSVMQINSELLILDPALHGACIQTRTRVRIFM